MKFILVDFTNYKKAIEIQNKIFPKEDGTINILASLDRDLFIKKTGIDYEDDNVKYYIAYENNEAIGITGLYYYDNVSAWLGWFGVLPDKRRKSYGERILEKTMELARQKGFKTMRLYTDAIEKADAIKLYKKNGVCWRKIFCRRTIIRLLYIYSKSLCNEKVDLWNNKKLGLAYQSQLDHLSKKEIKEILNMYE